MLISALYAKDTRQGKKLNLAKSQVLVKLNSLTNLQLSWQNIYSSDWSADMMKFLLVFLTLTDFLVPSFFLFFFLHKHKCYNKWLSNVRKYSRLTASVNKGNVNRHSIHIISALKTITAALHRALWHYNNIITIHVTQQTQKGELLSSCPFNKSWRQCYVQ